MESDATHDDGDEFDDNKANRMMDLYSRQISTFGVEVMKNLTKLNVLIVGLKGIGIETAKNIILAGPHTVAVYDNELVQIEDLGTNFFLTPDMVGQPRAKSCVDQLAKLNPYVSVYRLTDEVETVLDSFGAVVVTNDTPLSKLNQWSEICHNHPNQILFIVATTNGLMCSIFTDFGPNHVITDKDGEPVRINIIEKICVEKGKEDGDIDIIFTIAGKRHELEEGEYVSISGIVGKGIEKLNGQTLPISFSFQTYKEPGTDKTRQRMIHNQFIITQKGNLEEWDEGSAGTITQVKRKEEIKFRSFRESLVNPKNSPFLLHPNSEKRFTPLPDQLHFVRLALWDFQDQFGSLPRLHNIEDAKKLIEIAKNILEKHKKIENAIVVENIDEAVFMKASLYARTEVTGICTFVGGIAAQEIVKKFGKYSPLQQWLYMDYFELLGDEVPEDAKSGEGRYKHQISLFGQKFQEEIGKQRWFMIGCGALGCEYLKAFSLIGLGTKGGVLNISDMDTIELSNLNRQFLFRNEDIGKHKSVIAGAAAKRMNPDMNLVIFETPVGEQTENTFTDNFWRSLDGVCNALDNIEARKYSDSKCVFNQKPLLESGTLGTLCNSEVILPFKTLSYSEIKEDNSNQDDKIPMCTLRNFPHLIEHCIEWARAQFNDLFVDPIKDFNSLIKNPTFFFYNIQKDEKVMDQIDRLKAIKPLVAIASNFSFDDAIWLAFNLVINRFRDRILDLIALYPKDAVRKDPYSGVVTPFWLGSKKFPSPIDFDPLNPAEDQLSYLFATSNIYANIFGLPYMTNLDEFRQRVISLALKAPEWIPNEHQTKTIQNDLAQEEKTVEEIEAEKKKNRIPKV